MCAIRCDHMTLYMYDLCNTLLCPELSDSFDWASYLMEGIEYPTYSDSDEVNNTVYGHK